MFIKKDFKVDEKVRFVRTTDPRLDGQIGTVLGCHYANAGHGDSFIVLYDKPIPGYSSKAMVISEACLERV